MCFVTKETRNQILFSVFPYYLCFPKQNKKKNSEMSVTRKLSCRVFFLGGGGGGSVGCSESQYDKLLIDERNSYTAKLGK